MRSVSEVDESIFRRTKAGHVLDLLLEVRLLPHFAELVHEARRNCDSDRTDRHYDEICINIVGVSVSANCAVRTSGSCYGFVAVGKFMPLPNLGRYSIIYFR